VISRIVNGHPQSRLDELLPWGLSDHTRPQGGGLRTEHRLQTNGGSSVSHMRHRHGALDRKGLTPESAKSSEASIFWSTDACSRLRHDRIRRRCSPAGPHLDAVQLIKAGQPPAPTPPPAMGRLSLSGSTN